MSSNSLDMQNEQLQHKVEQTLDSINTIQRAEANPYLYTRIMERWKEVPSKTLVKRWVLVPASAALVIIIALNVGILSSIHPKSPADYAVEESYVSSNSYTY